MAISVTPKHLGRVVHPGDAAGIRSPRGTFNLLIDQQPEAIAFPADEREVAAVIADARERGLRVAAQATGHNAGAARLARAHPDPQHLGADRRHDRRRGAAGCASAPPRAGRP